MEEAQLSKARSKGEVVEERKRNRVEERITRDQVKREGWEAEIRAKQETEATKEREKEEKRSAKGNAKRQDREAKTAKIKARQEARVQEHRVIGEEVSAELYEGRVLLSVISSIDSGRLRKLEDGLQQVQNLSVVMVSGSADKGTTITVSAKIPIPLIGILRDLPHVEQVSRDGKRIQIKLRTE